MNSVYKMFEGCTIGNRIPFLEASSRIVFDKLGIQTSPAPFSCCPDPTGLKNYDVDTWLVLGARNLCLAEAEDKDIISLCNGCTNTLRGVKHKLEENSLRKLNVNKELAKVGKEYKGSIDVKHFVDVLMNDVGIDKIKDSISKSLSSLRVACQPGCHYMRPSEYMQADDPFRPENLKRIVSATGAIAVDYDELVLCCGALCCAAVTYGYNVYGLQVLKKKMDSIMKAGADVICVNCPACFQQFDIKQPELSKIHGTKYDLPVVYITELLALAMGVSPEDIGLKFHRIRLNRVLEKIGF